MFGRNSSKQVADATPANAIPAESVTSGKGRATPTRKEAETLRKQRLGALPADPRERRRAEKEAGRASYDRSRQALRSGDERY